MEDSKKLEADPLLPLMVSVDISLIELQILINALGGSQPVNKELEVIQFKLYHRLLFTYNGIK